MLRLAAAADTWVELFPATDDAPAVRVRFAPVGSRTLRAVTAAIRAAEGGDWAPSYAMAAELIRQGIREWEGIGDADSNPVPVTPETIEQFIADPVAFAAADAAYVMPWIRRDIEKNVSAGSPNGTSGAATPAPGTATSAAPAPKTARARRPRKATAAPTTPSTP